VDGMGIPGFKVVEVKSTTANKIILFVPL